VHARRELKRDYDRIIYADSGLTARAAYDAFVKKWTTLCAPVARSLEEAGLDLLTFYACPKMLSKALRTTNALENLNREFRRRTKTQASFSTEAAAVTLLFGLVAFKQIALRTIDGHKELPAFLAKEWSQAA
jgi:putative transposase